RLPQQVLPTMAVIIGRPARGVTDAIGQVDLAALVHGEQAFDLAGPIPVEGKAQVISRIAGLYDKGSAAVVVIETEATDGGTGRPILHGLCTYGFTGRALLHALCDGEAARFRTMAARFSKPAHPGDEFTVRIWVTGDGVATFHTSCTGGDVVIADGRCLFG